MSVDLYPICVKERLLDDSAESGPYLSLLERYGLSAGHIAEMVRQVIGRKELRTCR